MSMSVAWSFGRSLSILQTLQDKRLYFKVANAVAAEFRKDVVDYTETEHPFINRGKHQKLIRWKFDGPGAMAYTKAKHLAAMESGTKAHLISAKKAKILKMPLPGGGFAFAKSVNHPGTQPRSFFYADMAGRAARMTGAAHGVIATKLGIA